MVKIVSHQTSSEIPAEVLETSMLFQQPASFILAGKSGSGKTYFMREFLRHHRELGHTDSYRNAYICYREDQDGLYTRMGEYLTEQDSEVHLYPGEIPSDLYTKLDPSHGNLVIIDDMFSEAMNSEAVKQLFISGRHRKATVFLTTQNLFPAGCKHARTITLNASYIVLFRTRDLNQLRVLSQQLYGDTKGEFLKAAYVDATRTPGGHLLLDCTTQQVVDELRVRANVVHGIEGSNVYVP